MLRNVYQCGVALTRRKRKRQPPGAGPRWLVLFHHVPPKPDYLRVRIGRRLRRLGAIALKNSVYVLPATPLFRDGLDGIAREILERGGEAVVCEARFVAGTTDAALEDRFREARDAEYAVLATRAKRLATALRSRDTGTRPRRAVVAREYERLDRRYAEVARRDPFGAGSRESVAGVLSHVQDLLQGVETPAADRVGVSDSPRGATWVTRAGVMVDRIGSAWLIRRWIDRAARFKFVSPGGYRPEPGEIRFDMAGAEYTHEPDRCTFEVLLERFHIRDSALGAIGEIVHDLDLGDDRHDRPEAAGLGRMIAGLALSTADDAARIRQGALLFEGLYRAFRSASPPSGRRTGPGTAARSASIRRGTS
jgi:hypothetical protein